MVSESVRQRALSAQGNSALEMALGSGNACWLLLQERLALAKTWILPCYHTSAMELTNWISRVNAVPAKESPLTLSLDRDAGLVFGVRFCQVCN